MSNPAIGIAVFAGFIFCVVVHECAHAIVASWCGDDTGRLMGRITLNPIPHIDPVMSIIVPVLLWLSSAPIFGGAKPVPVNMMNLRHPIRDMMLVALAGPVSNVLLAIAFAGLLNLIPWFEGRNDTLALNYARVVGNLVYINVLLALFNLMPIPPLDGSRVLAAFLPERAAAMLYQHRMQAVGMALIALLVMTGGTRFLGPVIDGATTWLFNLTDLWGWREALHRITWPKNVVRTL